jgi:hypothetical protein
MIATLRANIAATIFGALAAVFALVAVVQTVKLDGFLWWDGVRDKLEKKQGELDRIIAKAREMERMGNELASKLRERNREEANRIVDDAGGMRLSGPGKARCPGIPAGTGRPEAQPRKPDAPGPEVPPDERAAVPWQWLVNRAEQCDLNRNEVISWREWHKQLTEAWPK